MTKGCPMPPKLVSRRITPGNIARLDTVEGIEPGAVSLHATDLDDTGYERLARFLRERGELVRILRIEPRVDFSGKGELQAVDFAACCPHLRTLDVKRAVFDDSVFRHPTLTDLQMRQSRYTGSPEITIGEEHPLRKLDFEDCHVKADRLVIAAGAPLKTFRYRLDEDYAEACPDNFDIYGERLEEITINACWSYTVTTNYASQRRNRRRTLRAGQYGSVTHIYHRVDGEKVLLRGDPA